MEDFNLAFHKLHIDTFFETFYINLENRNTYEDKINCFNFYLSIEEKRLNRYLQELKPDLYIGDGLYVDEIKNIILRLKNEKEFFVNSTNYSGLSVYKWEIDENKLKLLYEKLMDNFISSETTFETFKFLFSGKRLSEAKKRIIWLKISKNNFPNKKAITNLIDVLQTKGIISKPHKILKAEEITILNTLFSSNKGNLSFNNSNFVTPIGKSEYNQEFKDIIDSIL